MYHSASSTSIGSPDDNNLRSSNRINPYSKLKTYGFAIAIIVGCCGLVVGGVGVAGYFGAISNLNQVHAIIMMTAGGGGMIFFITGAVVSVKSCFTKGSTDSIDTYEGLIYGKDAWEKIWNVEVLDDVPDARQIKWDESDPFFEEAYRQNYVLIYIPEKIKFKGREKFLNLTTLKEITGNPFAVFFPKLEGQIGDTIRPGWVLVSKNVVPDSQNKNFNEQEEKIEEYGFRIPYALEISALILMVNQHTGVRLYPSGAFTTCNDYLDVRCDRVMVGGFDQSGLAIAQIPKDREDDRGVAAVLRVNKRTM